MQCSARRSARVIETGGELREADVLQRLLQFDHVGLEALAQTPRLEQRVGLLRAARLVLRLDALEIALEEACESWWNKGCGLSEASALADS